MADRPRVFVSSIMEGYEEYRAAARQGIERAGGKPVLIEDEPSRPQSPRNACLDLIASSDAILTIVGPRGGYRAPSGKLVVREEFDEAQRRNLPTVLLAQDVERDTDGEELVRDLSGWVKGRLRRTFANPQELTTEVERALTPLLETMSRAPQDPAIVQAEVEDPHSNSGQYDAVLRLAFAPVIKEEVFDPLDFDAPEFQKLVLQEAHACDLLQFQYRKKVRAASDLLHIEQSMDGGQDNEYAEITIETSGLVSVSMQVTGGAEDNRPYRERYLSSTFEILKGRLNGACSAAFQFLQRVLEHADPHERYGSWMYNVSLINPGMRRIVEEPARANHAQSAGWQDTELVTLYQDPRGINRMAFSRPEDEIRRIVALLQKRLDEARSLY